MTKGGPILPLKIVRSSCIREFKATLCPHDHEHIICLNYIAGQVNSVGVVLHQELDRFNQLLSTLQTTLTELQQAIKVGGS